jgi:hypothetical protein
MMELSKLLGTRVEARAAWRIDLAYERQPGDCATCLKPNFEGEYGLSQNVVIDRLDLFVLAHAALRPRVFDEFWGGGLGPATGLSYTPTEKLRIYALASRAFNLRGRPLDDVDAGIGLDLTPAWDLRLSGAYLRLSGHEPRREVALTSGFSF